MSPELGLATPVGTIAQRVKQLRGRRGWTAADLGKELHTKHELKWDRFTVANLENGKRQNVTVIELFALASVLDVAPVNLLVPLNDRSYQVTPTRVEPADDVRAWIRGESPLPGTDERTYFAEVSEQDMRLRIDAMRERYELGPFPEGGAPDARREARRMRQQNKRLLDEGGSDG
ncbi:helix-turn-helix transcriptional regulator [Streptomyces sp. NPDC057877]|uniref:helix-turn-helix transcriptional regulator n=1 Tax=Streptomyces sp. NPDC057877 TaxID=3346269 RepID=UPI0036ACEB76